MDYKNLPKLVSQKADALLEEAEQEELAHGLLSLLPVGGFLDSVLFRRVRQRARKRVEEFHLRFAEQLSKLDEEKVDKDFLESDEFDILVMKVVAKTVWEHSDEKRAFLRAILLNSVTVDFSKNPLKETIIELVGDLSPVHVRVLWAFSEGKLRTQSGFNTTSKLPEIIDGLRKLDAEAVTYDLFKKGLLDREEEFKTMEISGLGECLLAFLKQPFP